MVRIQLESPKNSKFRTFNHHKTFCCANSYGSDFMSICCMHISLKTCSKCILFDSKLKFTEVSFQRIRNHSIWCIFEHATNENKFVVQAVQKWQIHTQGFKRS